MGKLRYSDFWYRINVDAFEEAIGFSPEDTINDNDVGYCLFPENHTHGDTTGKFGIHREKRVYNCWACGGGDFLSLVMELYGFDVDEATEWLAQFCEEDMRTDNEFVDEFLDAFRDVEHRIATLPYFNERVLEQFPDLPPQEWLDGRGITPLVAKTYRVGYAEAARRPSPGKGKFAEEEDYYGPAVVFPHFYQERLVGWQCRWLDDERPEWVPKYTMTGDFPKESTLYGWDKVKASKEPVVVVESVPSALFVISHGYPAIATFGSSVNDAQMRLLRRFQGGLYLCPDNDKAGHHWVASLINHLKPYVPIFQAPLLGGEGEDVGDLADTDDPGIALAEYLYSSMEVGLEIGL